MSFQSVLSPQIIFFNAENAIFVFRFATLIAIQSQLKLLLPSYDTTLISSQKRS